MMNMTKLKKILIHILCLLPVFGIYMVVWFNMLDWYKKYNKIYILWYIISTLTILILYIHG